jgi:LmbE family N-acetylglucosaminyl deacetylase
MNQSELNTTILAMFAHPDDEAFGTGGILALNAAKGYGTALVTATRGEAGEISDPKLANRENLGQVREQELRKAAQLLGISELVVLDYRDSGMAGTDDNQHPQSLAQADADEVTEQLVGIIRRIKPRAVLTFDENGGYGHPDHIAIHKHTVAAYHAAGDSTKFTNQGEPWTPQRLYYSVFPKSTFAKMREMLKEHGQDTSQLDSFEEIDIGWPDDKIHGIVDVSSVVDAKWAALNSHKTQFGPDNLFNKIPVESAKELMAREYLVQIVPEVSDAVAYTDLFDGLES